LKEAERIIENHHRDRSSPEFRQAYDELRRSAKSPEQETALADIEKKLAKQTTIENRHGRQNEVTAVRNEEKQVKVAAQASAAVRDKGELADLLGEPVAEPAGTSKPSGPTKPTRTVSSAPKAAPGPAA
jgi:glutamate/tyrosine decarboxylase-like PLP-dependent enzyme